MNKLLFLMLLASLALTACAPSTPTVRPDPQPDADVAALRELAERGQLDQAAAGWLALAREQPDQAISYRLEAIALLLAQGDIDAARAQVEAVDNLSPSRSQRQRLDLFQAELDLVEGNLAAAAWRLAELADSLSGDLARRHAELEARLAERRENPARQALAALEGAIFDAQFAPELALALLIEYPLSNLKQLTRDHGHRPELAPWLDLAVTARGRLLDSEGLRLALADWETRHPNVGYLAADADEWLALWRQTRRAPARIGVILPGREGMARAGAAVREGLISAWMDMPPNRRPELLFRYIGDGEDEVIAAWFDLREAGADFLIGPLERHQVDSLARLPDPGLPILLLNHPDGDQTLAPGSSLHAFGLLPEDDAELAAAHALVAGHQRALVLHQNSDWGRRVATAFGHWFELGGGEVLATAEYSTRQVDHSALLEVILELDRSEQRIARLARLLNQPLESEAQRRTDVDVIFLAARPEDGRQIRPQLRFFGAGDIPVLSTSQIIAGAPDARRDEDIEGVVLPLPPWFIDASAQGQQRLQAARLFPHLDNPNLARLHALGADAMALTPWLDLMRADPALYLAGLTGRLRLTENQLIDRDQPMVRLVGGQARKEQ
ncbi:MAG: penicillin-binding protein activator [Wenzhouxiangella sp.]|nr:penicillin-binding protein activator [Wenzhouxiangella sp.]TVR95020.1 MAG: hypothetical protein EA418_08795 [Wenzhouxiangellaceae bacterium]